MTYSAAWHGVRAVLLPDGWHTVKDGEVSICADNWDYHPVIDGSRMDDSTEADVPVGFSFQDSDETGIEGPYSSILAIRYEEAGLVKAYLDHQ